MLLQPTISSFCGRFLPEMYISLHHTYKVLDFSRVFFWTIQIRTLHPQKHYFRLYKMHGVHTLDFVVGGGDHVVVANCPAAFLSYFHCGFVMKYSRRW